MTTKLPHGWRKLTGKDLEKRLRESRTLLTNASKKAFGKGHMNLKMERFESTDRTWALQYRFGPGTASRGNVMIIGT